MNKWILSAVLLTTLTAFSTVSLQAQCCTGTSKKETTKEEAPKKN